MTTETGTTAASSSAGGSEIRKSLRTLFAPDANRRFAVELRTLEELPNGHKVVQCGYFDNLEDLARVAEQLTARHNVTGVYMTLQQINPDLLARRLNRIARADKGGSTSDNDVLRFQYFMLDFDPVRPSGISATDAQHTLAVELSQKVRAALTELGWVAAVIADSGNGVHMLFRIDLPNDQDSRTLVKSCLQQLSSDYSTDAVTIDTSFCKPAQITRVYGTWNRKGESTTERPHRRSRILEVCPDAAVVTAEQLRALVDDISATTLCAPKTPAQRAPTTSIEQRREFVERFLHENDLECQPARGDGHGGELWTLRDCPFGGHGDFKAYVGVTADGAFYARCFKDGCKRPGDANRWDDLKEKYAAWFADSSPSASGGGGDDENLTTRIVHLVEQAGTELFHDPKQVPYTTISIDGHQETHRIGSTSFRRWIGHLSYRALGKVVSPQTLASAIAALEAKACIDGPEMPVFVRIAVHEGSVFLDLGGPDWGVIEITKDGWTARDASAPKFRRAPGLAPLPMPRRGGDLRTLRRFVNLTDADWPLLLGWLVKALYPIGPYPILGLSGEPGTAKSTVARAVRRLVDPNEAPLRGKPREARDVMIASQNGHVLAYDNLTELPDWLSDLLCMLATGGGYATRKLYTDEDEAIFDALRPIVTTSIDDILGRTDLLNRTLLCALPVIDEKDRRDERTFWAEFEREWAAIHGALLDAVVVGLRRIDSVRLPSMPRMADFARWAVACEPGLCLPEGAFLAAYAANRSEAIEIALENDPVAQAVRTLLVKDSGRTIGTSTELLGRMRAQFADDDQPPKGFPRSPKALSSAIKRITPELRSQGIRVTRERKGRSRARLIVIARAPDESVPCGPSVPPLGDRSASLPSGADAGGRIRPPGGTDPGRGSSDASAAPRPDPVPETGHGGDADARDASAPNQNAAPPTGSLSPDEVDAIFSEVDRNAGGQEVADDV